MEDNRQVLIAVAVGVFLLVLSKLKSLHSRKRKLNLPPGPWTLPVIGSLHHLVTNPPLIYRTLRALAQRHGPVMMLWLGEVPTLVVSSAEAAEAVLKTHDTSFADRYTNATLAALTFDGTDLGCAPYGERWRQLRKMCVLELLSNARVQSFQRIREEEVARFIGSVAASSAPVDVSDGIARFINDAFVRACVGSRCKHQDEYLHAFHEAILLTSGMTLADLFPSSRLMQALGTAPRRARAYRDEMRRIIEEIIREKSEAMDRGDEVAREGFIGVLLSLQKQGGSSVPITNDTIALLMFDLFAAGSDTSASVLNWTMTELVRHPAVMARAQAEVRETFHGKTRGPITEDDLAQADLKYLKLVVKESLRLHAHLPLLLPRRCREACQVMGYDVPEGTAVLVNAWAIGRDARYWGPDGEAFRPERFEERDVDFRGTSYEFLPFGSGRRMCPGVNLGLANINLVLVSLLYHFDWELPDGTMDPMDVDVQEAVGLIAHKKTNLVLRPVTRIPLANN